MDASEYEQKRALRSEQERAAATKAIEAEKNEAEARARREAERAGERVRAAAAARAALPYPVRLLEERCTECHDAGRFADTRHGRLGWELVLLRMQYLNGAVLEDGERRALSEHLVATQRASLARELAEALGILAAMLALPALGLGLHWRRRRSGPAP